MRFANFEFWNRWTTFKRHYIRLRRSYNLIFDYRCSDEEEKTEWSNQFHDRCHVVERHVRQNGTNNRYIDRKQFWYIDQSKCKYYIYNRRRRTKSNFYCTQKRYYFHQCVTYWNEILFATGLRPVRQRDRQSRRPTQYDDVAVQLRCTQNYQHTNGL